MKRVLILAYFFPPLGGGGVQRTSKFVKYLPSLGWSPVVITVREGAYWVADRTLEEELPSEAEIIRTRAPSFFWILRLVPGGGKGGRQGERSGGRSGVLFRFLRGLSSFFLVPDQYVGWVPFAAAAAARYGRRSDVSVIYSTSSPDSTHLAALLAKRVTGKPWVADFRDPWTERLTFRAPTPLHLWLHRAMERMVLMNANRVVCTSQEMVQDFGRKYPEIERDKFTVITNGFDAEDFARGVDLRQQFTISHTGILTGKRNCFGFLEGLKAFLAGRPDARARTSVLFVGTRDLENESRARALGLSDVVKFEDTLSHAECVHIQMSSHLLLLIEHESYRGSLIYPAKVFEYAASGRPVLALVPEGPAARLVRELGAGVTCSSSDHHCISKSIESFYDSYEAGRERAGARSRSDLERFERRRLTQDLSRLLDEVARTESTA